MVSLSCRKRLGVLLTISTLSFVIEGAARAQEEVSAADIASARALGQEGVKLADMNNCQEAVDKLARAEKIFHAPTTLGRLGECQVQLGKIVEGTENLNKVARESLAPGAPAAFAQAQERAKKVLAEAKPKIARLKIAVAGPSDVRWTVTVDGEPMPLANLNTNRPMDPGEHNIEATAPGYKVARAKVTLAEGGTDSVALTLEPDPNAPPAPVAPPVQQQAPVPQPLPQPPPQYEPPPSRAPAYVAFGVGVAGVAVGSIFGLMATGKKGDLDDACTANKICPPGQEDNIDTGKTFGTVSTVGFIVGAVGLAAGAYLFLTSSGPSGAKVAHASAPTTSPRPFVTVDRVGLVF